PLLIRHLLEESLPEKAPSAMIASGGDRMATVIIGGGAAGVAAAIAAGERGQRVLVLERNRKPLKKLGVTGNGRANLLNSGPPVYFGETDFALEALRHIGYRQLVEFFHSLGVPLREETEGRVYPAALQASVVTEALLLRTRQLGITWAMQTQALSLTREAGHFLLRAAQQPEEEPPRKGDRKRPEAKATPARELIYRADRVIVTVGGAAMPSHGTDGTGYGLLTALGHRVTPLFPALCALRTDKHRIAGMSGQRLRVGLKLLSSHGETLRATEGEILFGDDAVSGIAAMQLARFILPGAVLSLDLRPALGWDASQPINAEPGDLALRVRHLARDRAELPVRELFTGMFSAPAARLL
ncbi:FAD-dependent oxidoreductase, partial [Candidatus Falkowbacteria bacterium]|nr:FAD-dependent oxidoreductase [Candidatus Falkowbacteria bacterium]